MNRRQTVRVSREIKSRAGRLTAWLNGRELRFGVRENRARARILRIINLLQELQSALRPGTPLWKLPEVTRIEKDLGKLTRRYVTWPRFAVALDATYISTAHMWTRGSFEETDALSLIEQLLKFGLLDRLTYCETCKSRWVFRLGKKNKFCSLKCRQKPYEETARRKELKAARNKEYYDRLVESLKRKRKGKYGKR
jgi:hypothetical protein